LIKISRIYYLFLSLFTAKSDKWEKIKIDHSMYSAMKNDLSDILGWFNNTPIMGTNQIIQLTQHTVLCPSIIKVVSRNVHNTLLVTTWLSQLFLKLEMLFCVINSDVLKMKISNYFTRVSCLNSTFAHMIHTYMYIIFIHYTWCYLR